MNRRKLLLLCALVPLPLVAGSIADGVLTTFVSGQVANVTPVNANFAALRTAVNDNDSRIDTLETDVAGKLSTGAVPNCGAGQVLRKSGDTVSCVPLFTNVATLSNTAQASCTTASAAPSVFGGTLYTTTFTGTGKPALLKLNTCQLDRSYLFTNNSCSTFSTVQWRHAFQAQVKLNGVIQHQTMFDRDFQLVSASTWGSDPNYCTTTIFLPATAVGTNTLTFDVAMSNSVSVTSACSSGSITWGFTFRACLAGEVWEMGP